MGQSKMDNPGTLTTGRRNHNNKTTHYVLDITIRKQTQIRFHKRSSEYTRTCKK
jgi:hypothetical protein